MMQRARHLVVGIGSAHGDDRAGWEVIDALMSRARGVRFQLANREEQSSTEFRKASVPHDMIDWIDGCPSLHIVDACESQFHVQRLDHSPGQLAVQYRTRSGGSHQIGVGDVLELAESLGLLPTRVTIWTIPAQHFQPNGELSDACRNHSARCADLIAQELEYA